MISLKVKTRTILGRKTKILRRQEILPGILYGPKIENLFLEIPEKEFKKIFKETGKSFFISLEIDNKKYESLIYDISRDSLTGKILHVDFYCPSKEEKVVVTIPLVFEKEEEVQKILPGNILKEFWTIEVKSLPQHLPKEIKVNLSKLKDIGDKIQIKDLDLPEEVEILKNPEEIIVLVIGFEEKKEI